MLVKCAQCQEKNTDKEDMVKIEKGKQNIYIHNDCYQSYLDDKAFKEKERKERDALVNVIMQIHKIAYIPSTFFPYIEDLRNGTSMFGKFDKKYKEGLSYKTIEEIYIYCTDSIERAKEKKAKENNPFKNVFGELKYGLAIVRNNIDDAKRDKKHKEELNRTKQSLEKRVESQNVHLQTVEKNNDHKDELDISDFL